MHDLVMLIHFTRYKIRNYSKATFYNDCFSSLNQSSNNTFDLEVPQLKSKAIVTTAPTGIPGRPRVPTSFLPQA